MPSRAFPPGLPILPPHAVDELEQQGFCLRFSQSDPRLSELVAEYRALGFEVCLVLARGEPGQCAVCFADAATPVYHVYTRRKLTVDDPQTEKATMTIESPLPRIPVYSMRLPAFRLEQPDSLGEALLLLSAGSANTVVMAGGTDVLVKMKHDELSADVVVSLGRLSELREMSSSASHELRFGACCTMAMLEESDRLRAPWLCALAEGARQVGGPEIRERATIGGNIITARPCADTVAPLLVLGAQLELVSANQRRTVALDQFIVGTGQTRLGPDELLVAIELPAPPGPLAGSAYVTVARRQAMEVTVVGCAAAITLEEAEGSVHTARIALTSVAATPCLVFAAQVELEGHRPDAAAIHRAARAARAQARPITDFRAPASYRAQLVEVLVSRALKRALARAQQAVEER